MTELLYYKDAYLRSICSKVVEVRENGIVLDKTIFYPECGGQRGDRGSFGQYVILDTQHDKDGEVLHIIKGNKPKVGEEYTLTLDWENRYSGMLGHTSQHLISSVLFKRLNILTLSVHQGDGEVGIETDRKEISLDETRKIEDEVNAVICQNRRVYQKEMSRKEAEGLKLRRTIKVDGERIKVVFIEDLDAVPCGGVHLSSTGEIGLISYKGEEMIRSHVRLFFNVGDKAKEEWREDRKIVEKCKVLLSSSSSLIPESVEKLQNEYNDAKKEVKKCHEDLAKLELEEYVKKGLHVYETSFPLSEIQSIFLTFNDTIFVSEKEKNNFIFIGDKELFNLLVSSFPLKGGGKDKMYRGIILSEKEKTLNEIKKMLK